MKNLNLPTQPSYASRRSPVLAQNIVSTSHPLASQAGLSMIAKGGNAIDAAVASAITLTVELRKDAEGKDRQVQTIYLGLGQAYFADEKGTIAGTGVPGANGWTWTANAALAEKIRKVIDIYENRRPAEFVPVPVSVK